MSFATVLERLATLDYRVPSHELKDTPALPRVRVVYREASGAIHLDWPADQVARAIADS